MRISDWSSDVCSSDLLAELGYGDDRIVGDVFFRPDSDEQLTRVVLGMVPLKPLAIQAFDNRFDMPVPYDHDMLNAVEEIMLSPPSAGGCEIVVTGAPLTPPATFQDRKSTRLNSSH